jgi:hypothetical protein
VDDQTGQLLAEVREVATRQGLTGPVSVRAASVIARTHGFSIHAFRASGLARPGAVGGPS